MSTIAIEFSDSDEIHLDTVDSRENRTLCGKEFDTKEQTVTAFSNQQIETVSELDGILEHIQNELQSDTCEACVSAYRDKLTSRSS